MSKMWLNEAVGDEIVIEATVEIQVPAEVADREQVGKNLCRKLQDKISEKSLKLDLMQNLAAEGKIRFKVDIFADSLDSADDLICSIVDSAISSVGGNRLIRQGLTHLAPATV